MIETTDKTVKEASSSEEEKVEVAASPEISKKKNSGKMIGKMILVKQVGSSIRRDKRQSLYLKSLGLGKIGKTKELVDSNSVRSLIARVVHMVKVVE